MTSISSFVQIGLLLSLPLLSASGLAAPNTGGGPSLTQCKGTTPKTEPVAGKPNCTKTTTAMCEVRNGKEYLKGNKVTTSCTVPAGKTPSRSSNRPPVTNAPAGVR